MLKDATEKVVRTGRTGNLAVRKAQLARHKILGKYTFEAVYKTDSYAAQRGLEQVLYDRYPNALLNRIRAIRLNHPDIKEYMAAAEKFLADLES